jgi:hypothetical protein
MIDICTVVFEEEIPILKIQAESVGMFCQSIGVRNIYVVLNDVETLSEKIDPAWWGPLASSVLIVPRTTFSTQWVDDGWLSQQLWKLLAASISYNHFTMVLDAKTILTKPINVPQLFDSQGRLMAGRIPVQEVFAQSKQIVEQLFDIKMTEQLGPGGVPYFFHNDTVRALISDVTFKVRESFPTWFQKQGVLTEYLLYSGYVQFKYESLDSLYGLSSGVAPRNLCHSDMHQADKLFEQFKHPEVTSVGIHRKAWQQLTPAQKTQYRMLLIDRGIVSAWDL